MSRMTSDMDMPRSRTSKGEFSGWTQSFRNSGFFEDYSPYKSRNTSSEIIFSSKERNETSLKSLTDIFNWIILSAFVMVSRSVCLVICIWCVNRVLNPVLRGQPCLSWIKKVWCSSSLLLGHAQLQTRMPINDIINTSMAFISYTQE